MTDRARGTLAMTRLEAILACALAVGASVVSSTPIQAQQRVPGWERVAPAGGHQNDLQLLRPTGGPVVPIFEGWYTNADGTHQLCFGYFNVNTEEVLEIPVGPDNHVEPEEFNGLQPTHFLPVPSGGRRHYCTFSATVPADWGDRDLVWTLRDPRAHGMGQEYASPGRITFEPYHLEEPLQKSRQRSAPKVRLGSEGPVAVGRTPVILGPYQADSKEPMPLNIWIRRDNPFNPADQTRVAFRWYKYQGPGEVTFQAADRHRLAPGGRVVIEPETWLESSDSWGSGETEASFGVPGDYRLLLQVYNDSGGRIQPSDFEFFCCWTNVLVDVTVVP
jgi:hypothetical protein